MQEIRDGGRTLVYVSHAAGSVRRMCDRVLVLEKGRLGFDGDVDEGIKYLALRRRDDDGDRRRVRRIERRSRRRRDLLASRVRLLVRLVAGSIT